MPKTKYIETPDTMWNLFQSYRKETKSKPILKHTFVGKDGNSEYEKRERPLTLEGFEVWCYDNDIITNLSQYFANTEDRYTEYQTVCSRIRKTIKADQIEGGMAMIYNPSITQRLNGLVEKTSVDIKTEQPLFPEK
jgi:hypothetical protein